MVLFYSVVPRHRKKLTTPKKNCIPSLPKCAERPPYALTNIFTLKSFVFNLIQLFKSVTTRSFSFLDRKNCSLIYNNLIRLIYKIICVFFSYVSIIFLSTFIFARNCDNDIHWFLSARIKKKSAALCALVPKVFKISQNKKSCIISRTQSLRQPK